MRTSAEPEKVKANPGVLISSLERLILSRQGDQE